MKIKEKYSKEFEHDDKIEIKTLKEDKELSLVEYLHPKGSLSYSEYYLLKDDKLLMGVSVPDPSLDSTLKSIFLKYQSGAKLFMKDFFDVLIRTKKDIEIAYKEEQEDDISYEVGRDSQVRLYVLGENGERYYPFGWIGFSDAEQNKRVAENFINYFTGKPIEYSWEELCEQ